MYLTDAQLSRVRTRPHRTRLWLGIYQPTVIFQGRINSASIVKGERDITLDGTSGDFNLIQGGETCYISTIVGGKELGRVRVKSATATVLTLAENAITWIDDWYVTVVRYFEPWGVYPRVTLDSDNDPTFFKDYDIAYTDQNTVLDPIICLGPNHAGFLEPDGIATGIHQIWYTSSGTFDPTEDSAHITGSTFDWHFEGGDPTGSADVDPGYVSYTGCGQYVTSLSVTTAGGAVFTGRRHVQILTRPDQVGSCKPFSRWGLRSLEGNRDAGGYNARIWVRDVVDTDVIVDGALIVVFSEDWEGGTNEGITGSYVKTGANAENRDQILFTGYILEDSIRLDPITSQVDFKVGSITQRMSELSTFSIALDAEDNGEPWTVFPSLTTDRTAIHYMRWHSTVLAVADFSQTGETKRLFGTTLGRGNLFETIDGQYFSDLMASIVSDRQGKIWAEVNENYQPTGSTRQNNDHMQSVIRLSRQDWRNQIGIERDPHADLSYVELGGVAYSGLVTGTFDPYLSGAPGEAPDYFGKAERVSGLAIFGQDQLNELSGNVWASRNALYPKVQIPLAGDYRFLDIAPQHRVELTLAEGDTFRHVEWINKPFIPQAVVYRWDAKNQALMMDLAVAEETDGSPGDTVLIPVNPPYDRLILPDWDIDFPPIIPPDPIEPPVEPPPGTGDLIYLCTNNRLTRSRNFVLGRATGSSWTDITPTWGGSNVTGIFRNFYLDPADPINAGYLHTDLDAEGFPIEPAGPHLYRVTNLNGPTGTQSYTEILDPATFGAIVGANPGDGNRPVAKSFAISPVSSNVIFGLGRVPGEQSQVVFKTADGGASWEDVTNAALNPTTGPSHGPVFASPFSVVNFWTVGGLLSRRFYGTLLQGATWTELESSGGSLHDMFHMPVNGNPIGFIWYWTVNTPEEMYITDDNFATSLAINPIYDGEEWWAGNSTQSNDQEGRPRIATWAQNRLRIAAICHGQTSSSRFVLFHATDGLQARVNSWLPRYEFAGPGGTELAGPLLWHDTNQNLMALIFVGNDDQLWLSVDEGVTWIGDGLNRWEEDIGTISAPDNLGFVVAGLRWPSVG